MYSSIKFSIVSKVLIVVNIALVLNKQLIQNFLKFETIVKWFESKIAFRTDLPTLVSDPNNIRILLIAYEEQIGDESRRTLQF